VNVRRETWLWMSRNVALGWVFAGVAIGGALHASLWATITHLLAGPPIRHQTVEVITPTVEPGGTAIFRYTTDRRRMCAALITGFLIDKRTGEAVERYAVLPGGYGDIGRDVSVYVSRPVPPHARPGLLCYRSTTLHACADAAYTTQSPDACFEVATR
jgi:hypothetical protein